MRFHRRKHWRKRWLIRGRIIAASVAVFLVALELSEPAPPSSVRLATGPPGGAYSAYGKRLAARLRELGLRVELVQTQGSLENYKRASLPSTPTSPCRWPSCRAVYGTWPSGPRTWGGGEPTPTPTSQNDLYHWRMHLRLVRNDAESQLARLEEGEAAEEPPRPDEDRAEDEA